MNKQNLQEWNLLAAKKLLRFKLESKFRSHLDPETINRTLKMFTFEAEVAWLMRTVSA